jgi:hypothetical protein
VSSRSGGRVSGVVRPLKAEPAGALAADGVAPVRSRGSLTPRGAGVAAGSTAPPGQPHSLPIAGPDDRSRGRHLERSARPARAGSRSPPGNARRRRELTSEPGMPSAELAGQARKVDQDIRLLRLLQRLQRRHHCR